MFYERGSLFLFIVVVTCTAVLYATGEVLTPDILTSRDVFLNAGTVLSEECNCGENSISCVIENDKTVCGCKEKFYDNGKGKCIGCDCGDLSTGCKLEKGQKICSCPEEWSDKNGKCEYCSCGDQVVDKTCFFQEDGSRKCNCKPGFVQSKAAPNADCIAKCNETSHCLNGGYCDEDGACLCRAGTGWPFCEVVYGCSYAKSDKTCGDDEKVECVFDTDLDEAVCRCPKVEEIFDKYDKKCKVCDCGKNGRCFFYNGDKRCDCDQSYFPANGTCSQCSCGVNSWSCFITEKTGLTTCACMQGYYQYGNECKECDCGKNGYCSFKNGEKKCECRAGYTLSNGVCQKCDCGNEASSCSFDEAGKTICKCNDGFSLQNGICYDFDECERVVHDCPPISTWCVNTVGSYECICKEGFQRNVTTDVKKVGCDDINECLDSSSCPVTSSTVCVNSPGSFECKCKDDTHSKMKTEDDKFNSPRLAGCEATESVSWKTISIICLTVLCFLIFGLAVVLFIAKRRRQRQ